MKSFIFILFCLKTHAFTINVDISNLAEVEIYFFKEAPANGILLSYLINQHKTPISHYSFLINSKNQVICWESCFTKKPATMLHNVISSGASRICWPKTLANPFTIELTANDIELIIGEILTEMYVIILQRTYYFDEASKKIRPLSQKVITSGIYAVNDVIELQASGNIDPSLWMNFPNYLKNIYSIASGSVS